MRTIAKITITVVCVAAISLALAIYGLFHGYFDPGQFEIKQVQWSSSKQVAMVAERSDHDALGGLTYFVLIGNHLFSPAELRHAYHSDATIFAAGNNCINLHWEGSGKLVITCNGSTVDSDFIDVQKQQSGNVAISYENIPIKGPK
jgi:hypothetical protein